MLMVFAHLQPKITDDLHNSTEQAGIYKT